MAITSSAKKALRASEKKAVLNTRRDEAMKAAIKQVKKLVADKKVKEAQTALSSAYQAIDKAVKTNFLKANAGARKKSRLSAMIVRAKAAK